MKNITKFEFSVSVHEEHQTFLTNLQGFIWLTDEDLFEPADLYEIKDFAKVSNHFLYEHIQHSSTHVFVYESQNVINLELWKVKSSSIFQSDDLLSIIY